LTADEVGAGWWDDVMQKLRSGLFGRVTTAQGATPALALPGAGHGCGVTASLREDDLGPTSGR
jgi:hypothetical protein